MKQTHKHSRGCSVLAATIHSVLWLSLASASQAQNTGANEGPDLSLPVISVRDVLPSDLRFSPGAASTLTAEEIRSYRPLTLHDALDFVPGVFTIDDDALGRRSGIGIRGAPARRSRKVLLLEDGAPINASTYLDSSAHYTPPIERLERVEVLRANGQIVHGPLNNHGIINFRNKQATATPETTLELGAGNLGLNKRHLMHTRTEGDVGLVFAYTGMNGDGVFDVEKSRFDDFYGSVQWDINERHSLATSLTYYRERSNYDESNLTPVEYALAPRNKRDRFVQQYNTFALDYLKLDVTHDYQISKDMSMSTKFFATELDRPRFTVDPGDVRVGALPEFEYANPSREFIPGVQGRMVSRDRLYRTMGLETRLEKRNIAMGDITHTLQWGLRVERHTLDDNRSTGATGQIINRNNQAPTGRNVEYEAEAASIFIQNVMQYGDWIVTPGLRGEYFMQSRQRRVIPLDPGPHGPRETDHNAILLPGISALYTGLDNSEIFASVQRGYSPAMARTAAGFPLVPETGINTQAGIRSTLLPGLRAEAALFYNRLQNTIVQLPITIGDGDSVVINSGDSQAYGLDLGLRFDSIEMQPDAGYNLFAELVWSVTRATFRGGVIGGNRVPEIPSNNGSFSLGVQHHQGWELSATLSYVGNFFTDPENTGSFVLMNEDLERVGPGDMFGIREPIVVGRVPSHTLVSARASYTPPEHQQMTLWLQGRNLGDRLYITDLANGIRPGAERSVLAGLTYRF